MVNFNPQNNPDWSAIDATQKAQSGGPLPNPVVAQLEYYYEQLATDINEGAPIGQVQDDVNNIQGFIQNPVNAPAIQAIIAQGSPEQQIALKANQATWDQTLQAFNASPSPSGANAFAGAVQNFITILQQISNGPQ